MLPCRRSSSNSMDVPASTSRPLGSGGGACCRQAGSLAELMSITLLWVHVRDCGSGVASDAFLKSDSCCASCVRASAARDCTVAMVNAVVCGCCCGSAVLLLWRCPGCCGRAL